MRWEEYSSGLLSLIKDFVLKASEGCRWRGWRVRVSEVPVICVMAPSIHLGVWSMALVLWLPFELPRLVTYAVYREYT